MPIKNPKRSNSIIGISFAQFQSLSIAAINRELEQRVEQEQQKTRINKKGAGNPRKLAKEAEICLTLYYLKHTPKFEVLGLEFDVSKTTAHTIFHFWIAIIRYLLPASLMEEANTDRTVMELQTELEVKELIIDSCEQARTRPLDNQKQQQYYSGKKGRHTFKSQIIVLPKGKDIVDVITGVRGPEADVTLLRKCLYIFSDQQRFIGDKAYVGEAQISTPKKKPKGGSLTQQQKEDNRELSKRRIYVEHLIGRLKTFRVIREKFPLSSSLYQIIFLTVCGLTRLQMGTSQFT